MLVVSLAPPSWYEEVNYKNTSVTEELLTVTEGMEARFLSSFKRSLCIFVYVRVIQ